MVRILLVSLLSISLMACVIHPRPPKPPRMIVPTSTAAILEQSQRDFESNHYKHAMMILLPLACDGLPQAQYAVGYLYYYGYGVTQDTDVGYFWISRAADQGYRQAIEAEQSIRPEEKARRDLFPRSAPLIRTGSP